MKSDIPKSLQNINLKAVLRSRGIYAKQTYYLELKQAAMPLAKRFIDKKRSPKNDKLLIAPKTLAEDTRRHAQFTNQVLDDYWQKQIHIVETVEKQFEKRVEQYIKNVEKDFLSQLDTEVNNNKDFVGFVQKDYFSDNEEDLLVKAQLDFTPLLDTVAVLAGQEANKLIGLNTPYLSFNYRSQIADNVNKFTQSLLDTDRNTLTDLISNGLQNGNSIPEIRSSIQQTFDSYSKTQAQRITRTEVIRASNQAALDAYQQSGVVEGKQWLTAGAVDECAEYEGQIVTLSDSFYGSDSEFQDGDPPLHPNCRCVVIPIVTEAQGTMSSAQSISDLSASELSDLGIDAPEDAPFTAYHGEGHNLSNGNLALGDAFYVSRSHETASIFGSVSEVNIPFGDKSILMFETEEQYQNAVTEAIKQYPNTPFNQAFPKYIKSLGYKAAEVHSDIDPLAGIAIYDKKSIPKSALEDYINELEGFVDKRTRAFKELQSLRGDDQVYIKSLEKHLGVSDEPPTEA